MFQPCGEILQINGAGDVAERRAGRRGKRYSEVEGGFEHAFALVFLRHAGSVRWRATLPDLVSDMHVVCRSRLSGGPRLTRPKSRQSKLGACESDPAANAGHMARWTASGLWLKCALGEALVVLTIGRKRFTSVRIMEVQKPPQRIHAVTECAGVGGLERP